MFILRPVREKFSDLNRSAVRKRLPTAAVDHKTCYGKCITISVLGAHV